MNAMDILTMVLAIVCVLSTATSIGYWWWRYVMSIRTVAPNQRGVRKNWNKLETRMYEFPKKDESGKIRPVETEMKEGVVFIDPGKVYCPWIPNWVYGYQPYDLVLIPTDEFKVAWNRTDLENFWTANGIRITKVQVNSIQSLPYNDEVAMLRALRANVPMQVKDYPDGREGMQSWEEQPIMSQVRIQVRKRAHDYFTGRCDDKGAVIEPPDFTAITSDVNAALRDGKSPLLRAGLFGTVVEDLNPGMGNLDVSIEAVEVDEDFRKKLQGVVTAPMDVKIAEQQATASAALFNDTNQALNAWLRDQRAAGNEPTKAEIAATQRDLHERALAKTPGWSQLHVKGLENATTAVVGGGGAGLMVNNQGRNRPGNQNPAQNRKASREADAVARKDPKDMTDAEREEELRRLMTERENT